jgi:hypothetical protein
MSARSVRTVALSFALVLGLAGMAHASSYVMGNEAIARSDTERPVGGFTVCDTNNSSALDGTIDTITYYAVPDAGSLRFVIADAARMVTWVSEPVQPPAEGGLDIVELDPLVAVSVGSNLCVWTSTSGSVSSDLGLGEAWWFDFGSPEVGSTELAVVQGGSVTMSMNATMTPAGPNTGDACRDGGWEDFGHFANQGKCIASLMTAGRADRSVLR